MASPAPPTPGAGRPPPHLRTIPADEPTAFTYYRKYVTNNPDEQGNPPPQPFPIPPLPSAAELQGLDQEMQNMAESRKLRAAALKANQDIMAEWLRAGGVTDFNNVGKEKVKAAKVKLKLGPAPGGEPPDGLRSEQADGNRKRKRENDAEEEGPNKIRIPPSKKPASGEKAAAGPSSGIIPNGAGTPSHKPSAPNQKATPKAKKKAGKKSQGYKKNQNRPDNKLKKRASMAGEDVAPPPTPPEPEEIGEPMEGDYSRAKPAANQTPIATFWQWCDQFFRNITEEDLAMLGDEDDEFSSPYIVPKLGKKYHEQWADDESRDDSFSHLPPGIQNCEYFELDDFVREGDISIPALDERLMSAFIAEGVVAKAAEVDEEQDNDAGGGGEPGSAAVRRSEGDYLDFEERVRRELRFVGLASEDEEGIPEDEDDEICAELREKQEQLRLVAQDNARRKKILRARAEDWMGKQQYYHALDELNKAVEAAFTKRFKTPAKAKGAKKRRPGESGIPIADDVMEKLENRKMFVEMGKVFSGEKYQIPRESIYNFEEDVN
ncbi:Transcriptional regulator [Rhizophlyctis rosea]|uniref:Transcriptional regulator n=1 Tax=Rhizophlyctis rosea TaxID=64517 RepID=A0AAD5S2C0_9FUNG|nr:Transcriptional regulator [Rhizophlyctis rosea]